MEIDFQHRKNTLHLGHSTIASREVVSQRGKRQKQIKHKHHDQLERRHGIEIHHGLVSPKVNIRKTELKHTSYPATSCKPAIPAEVRIRSLLFYHIFQVFCGACRVDNEPGFRSC
jgi:hypothetical protein